MSSKLLFQDWMFFHPYEKPWPTDYHYFAIAKKVQEAIYLPHNKEFTDFLSDEIINELSCYLTAYFEDIISQTNIWQSFTNQHLEIYKTYLPFYKTDEYFHEEINYEDVCFLLWYFIENTGSIDFIDPKAYYIQRVAIDIMNVFDEEFETAPENEALISFFDINENESDFYIIRAKIDWLTMHSYLFYFRNIDFNLLLDEFIAEKPEPQIIEYFIKETYDNFVVNKPSALLALRGKDWLAALLGTEHSLYHDIKNIGTKKSGVFMYKKTDKEYVYLEHIATSNLVKVTLKSITPVKGWKADDTIFHISLVTWQDEWWLTGSFWTQPFNADLILDEKNNMNGRLQFANKDDEDEQRIIIADQYITFLLYNNNSPIAYFKKGSEIEPFIQGWTNFWNNTLNLSIEDKKTSLKRLKKEGITNLENELGLDDELKNEPGLVFYNEQTGIEMFFGYNQLITDNKNTIQDVQFQAILNLFRNEYSSCGLVKYMAEHYNWLAYDFRGKEFYQIIANNMDFFLRLWKSESYNEKSHLTIV